MMLAVFPCTNLYAHFEISHKTLDGNAKMRINPKNAHKKNVCAPLIRTNFLCKKKNAQSKKCTPTMETHLPNKSPHVHRKK